jgi:HD-GYP domain-containing protein (c-di-GMP phosphodiesterase class II)
MRFRTRAFLLSFVPFAILLTGSFWSIQKLVESTVRSGLRDSLRANDLAISRLRSHSDLQNSRFLRIAGENASLKAGLQLILMNAGPGARETVEDQLSELCNRMGFDFLLVSTNGGKPLAGVWKVDGQATAVNPATIQTTGKGLMMHGADVYQIASVPIDQGNENLGILSVGERFDFSGFTTPAVLIRDSRILMSTVPGVRRTDLEKALRACNGGAECDVRLSGQSWISLPVDIYGDGYTIRTLQNVDAAGAPVRHMLQRVFLFAAVLALLVALLFSVLSAQSIVGPIAKLVKHLQKSESTGLLSEIRHDISPVREIRELTASFNQAAGAIQEARSNLQRAYVGFVGSLASALDARDRYTAGHSRRVSDLACATALALGITGERLEEVRIGALLHDIGKIGVPDAVLQKPGKLSDAEFAIVKTHPQIGRRILEGVTGFAPYLDSVELHHENWDGSGYPWGQRGLETPIAARIIHVADAYDAMTTDRPYRPGMRSEEAVAILRRCAGTQFDPLVVEAFSALSSHRVAETKEEMLVA